MTDVLMYACCTDDVIVGMSVASVDYLSDPEHAYTTLHCGIRVRSKYVVLATGGLSVDPSLAGVLTPCWSYLVGIADPRLSPSSPLPEAVPAAGAAAAALDFPHSPNLFTWGFTHDWCMTGGHLRISGEDHFSALKPPRMQQRCAALAQWTVEKYPYLAGGADGALPEYAQRYGVYSETPDSVPLVGLPYRGARVCYLLGCNAWGQASLSYAASLVPGMLGYHTLSASQKDKLKLLTIRRFAMLPVVRNVKKE
jgi:glycine/D-amino acid oxidase-like deaminating enzyme